MINIKCLFLSTCILCFFKSTNCQVKAGKAIDFNVIENWTSVSGGSLNEDGSNALYYQSKQMKGESTLIIKSTTSTWSREFKDASHASFTRAGNVVFELKPDTLCFFEVRNEKLTKIASAENYKLIENSFGSWLVYNCTPKGNTIIRNLENGKEAILHFVKDIVGCDYECFILRSEPEKEGSFHNFIDRFNLTNFQGKNVWSSSLLSVSATVVDQNGKHLAFITEANPKGNSKYQLLEYDRDLDSVITLIDTGHSIFSGENILSNNFLEFSKNGKQIYFSLKREYKQIPRKDVASVDIWSYLDTKLQSVQLEDPKRESVYRYLIDIRDKHLIKLENENEKTVRSTNAWILVRHDLGTRALYEATWNPLAQLKYYLVSSKNGERKLIKDHILTNDGGIDLSPNGKWAVYFDFAQKNYYSYETASGIVKNISGTVLNVWTDEENDRLEPSLTSNISWFDNGEKIIVSDTYDIWLLDPSGGARPINVTNGYGRKHKIKFKLLNNADSLEEFSIKKKSLLLLKAFNTESKDMGFYKKELGVKGDPVLCSMGPYVFGSWSGYGTVMDLPIKAGKANKFLIMRMTEVQAPNYYFTEDFKVFRPISDIQPQKDCSWLTTKLVHWITLDGKTTNAILYIPENFDSSKKYPLIFDYYEKRSNELHLFIQPEPATDRINIPWFVSNGYIVCVPDIVYQKEGPGMGAYNTVVAGAKYLSRFHWINEKRMGLQGHSFGGYETNFIITHTNLFAAACSASGFCDLFSWYASGARGSYPMYWAERGQGRLEKTPWELPDLYISNSPIHFANRVNTPLLMMNNKEDKVVLFGQGVEFFTALRRLGKKVWMLQYDGNGHSLDGYSQFDYTIRLSQFFDHYLKGSAAPRWMTRSIPAILKGIDTGLDLDLEIKTPNKD